MLDKASCSFKTFAPIANCIASQASQLGGVNVNLHAHRGTLHTYMSVRLNFLFGLWSFYIGCRFSMCPIALQGFGIGPM